VLNYTTLYTSDIGS